MTAGAVLGSVVIPAHDEAVTVARCLDALFGGHREALDVVVVCNGCRDDTAERARATGHPVRVLELREASKAAALRAGDGAVTALPRLYLDADVALPGASAVRVLERLRDGAVAARPRAVYDTSRSGALVRSYYRARTSMPALNSALWGAGVFGLSAAGRARFAAFPDVVGDDLWVDRHFERDEIEVVDCEPVVVSAPRRTSDLVRILRRSYRGKADAAPAAARTGDTTASTTRDLARVAVRGPSGARDAATYAAFAVGARAVLAVAAARPGEPAGATWERDASSRRT